MTDLQEERVTIVVGTGVTVAATNNQDVEGCKVATWPGLLLHGVQYCKELNIVDDFDVNVLTLQINSGRTDHIIAAAETIANKMRARSPGVYRGWLKSTIGALHVVNKNILEVLGSLPGVLATLNYDNVIEDVTGRRAITWLKTDEVEEVLNGRYEDTVIHLHGWFREPESVVLGISSYLNVKDHSHAKSVLQHFVIGRTLLFVGCGATFEDPNFHQLIQWGKDAIADVAPRHYVLCRASELTQFQTMLDSAPWLQPLSYGEKYSCLVPFLQSLVSVKPLKITKNTTDLNLDLDAYRRAMLARFKRIKIEQLDPTTHDIRPLTLNSLYIDQHAKECTTIVPRVFELPKELQHKLRGKGELEGTEFDDATLAQYRRAYLDGAPRLVSEILMDTSCSKVVILGDPGSGKSTLLQHVVLQWAEKNPADTKIQNLPLLIELREFARFAKQNESDNFLEYLQSGAGVRWHLDQDAVKAWLKENNSLVLFDGLDEIFDLAQRREISTSIHRFSHEYPLAKIVVTSRVVGYQHQAWNDEGFRQFMLQDLDQEKIENFLRRWHKAAYEEIEESEKKRLLLEGAIKDSAAIRQLAGNPLLLTMMAVLNRTQDLPRDRAELYEQCARLLLHQWKIDVAFQTDPDLANASLDFKDKRGLLLRVARAMHSGERGLAGNLIDEDTLESTLAAGLNEIRVARPSRAARALIEQLRGRNFMLCFMGGHSYAFVHRTFLEYFCALEIRDRFEKERSLSLEQLECEVFGHWADETWHEVLCLLAGMISGKFAEQTIQWLINQPDPNATQHNVFVALRCLGEIRNRVAMTDTELTLRRLAKKLSMFEPAFSAPPWTVEGQVVSEIRGKALRLISTVWPDENDNCRWFKYIALSDNSWDVPEIAVRLLAQGWRDDNQTFEWLKEQVAKGRSRACTSAMLELVLGWKKHPDTRSIIASAFKVDRDDATRASALERLIDIDGPTDEMRDHLLTAVRKDKTYYVAYVATQELTARWKDDPEVFSTLISLAKSANHYQRHLAVQVLIRNWNDHPDAAALIKDILENEKESTVLNLTQRLVFETWHDRDFAVSLAKRIALSKGNVHKRQGAIDLLIAERRNDSETLDIVMSCTKVSFGVEIRAHAARSLAAWADNFNVVSYLKNLLSSRQAAEVRKAALQSLTKTWGNSDEIINYLVPIAKNDKSIEVRKAAILEIIASKQKPEVKLDLLKNLLLDSNLNQGVHILIISNISKFLDIDSEVYKILVSTLERNPIREIRVAAIRAIIDDCSSFPETLPLLKRISLKDKNFELRLPAVAELIRRANEDMEILSLLKKISKDDRSKAVRIRAIRGLARGWSSNSEVAEFLAKRKMTELNKDVRKEINMEIDILQLIY